jgi:predicted acetyltransferase
MTSPTKTAITLHTPTPDQVFDYLSPLAIAFGEVWTPDERDLEVKLLEADRMVGAFDGEAHVGCAAALTFRITVPGGREVGAAGVSIVGVLPTHTRRGILRQMMTRLIADARERGEPVAVLGASEAAIYQRFGFGIGALQSQFEIEPVRATFREPVEGLGTVRFVDPDEATRLFPAIYDAVRARTPGCLSRTEDKWRWNMVHDAEWMRGGNGAKSLVILEVDGEPRAYAIYRVKADWDNRGPKNSLITLEVLGVDPAAQQAMWQWLFRIDLLASIKTVRGPVPHPLSLQLTEPKRLGLVVKDELWLRILDVDKALEARTYAGAGTLTFDLTDDFCPWNAGRWQLTVPGGGADATLRPAKKGTKADIALDISALNSIYLGTHSFSDLARANRVSELRERGIAAAGALFATEVAPWSSTPF